MTSNKIKTEEEEVLFEEHAKLFRFLEKEWRERGTGVMKVLHNASLRSVRVLMRRNQTHKICAHHLVSSQVELLPMETLGRGWLWTAQDYADEELRMERFCCRFKTKEIATKFGEAFVKAKAIAKEREESSVHQVKEEKEAAPAESSAKKRRNSFSMADVMNTSTSYRDALHRGCDKERDKILIKVKSFETSTDNGQSDKKVKPDPVDESYRVSDKKRDGKLIKVKSFETSTDNGQSDKKVKPDPVDESYRGSDKERDRKLIKVKSFETSTDITQSAKKMKPNPVDKSFIGIERERERYIELIKRFETSADIGQSDKKIKLDPVDELYRSSDKERDRKLIKVKSFETSADIGQSAKKMKHNSVEESFRAIERERYIELIKQFGTSADNGQSAKKIQADPVDAFLAVIAPTLKSLTPQLLNLAKSEIFASVQKYEKEMLVKDYP